MSAKDHRPWGWFEILATQNRFQVKRIMVSPGAALSLQSHNHRSEYWIVVEGTIRVTVDDKIQPTAHLVPSLPRWIFCRPKSLKRI